MSTSYTQAPKLAKFRKTGLFHELENRKFTSTLMDLCPAATDVSWKNAASRDTVNCFSNWWHARNLYLGIERHRNNGDYRSSKIQWG